MTLDDLVQAIKALYPAAVRVKDYTTAGSDNAVTIATWNNTLGAQPTEDQLAQTLVQNQLSAAKAIQLRALSLSYTRATAADVPYMGSTFLADPSSQQIFGQAITIYNSIGSVPDGFFTVDASGNKVPMTLPQLQGLGGAIAAQVWTCFQRWVAVRESLAVATTLTEVQAVVW